MKKSMKQSIALFLAAVIGASLAGCGGKGVKEVNTTTASYEEMVSYLEAKGFIEEGTEPVDINATGGYLTDNTGGEFTETVVADKAYDYNGLWLFWWDLENQTDNYENFEVMGFNDGVIVLAGGAAILPTEARSGAFAIAFSQEYEKKDVVLEAFSGLPSE